MAQGWVGGGVWVQGCGAVARAAPARTAPALLPGMRRQRWRQRQGVGRLGSEVDLPLADLLESALAVNACRHGRQAEIVSSSNSKCGRRRQCLLPSAECCRSHKAALPLRLPPRPPTDEAALTKLAGGGGIVADILDLGLGHHIGGNTLQKEEMHEKQAAVGSRAGAAGRHCCTA